MFIIVVIVAFCFIKRVYSLSARYNTSRKNYDYFARSTSEYNRKAEEKRRVEHEKELEKKAKAEEKRRMMEEKQRKIEAKEAEQAAKMQFKKELASSELEYIQHRMTQIQNLINIAEEKQEGTLYGGKEWTKYEKDIMKYESQYQALKIKERKAWNIKNK